MGINVLSLFDGISCGRVALERAGIAVDNYYASEIDKYAITIAQKNFPGTVQLGDIETVDISQLPQIDILFCGFPCQDLSIAGNRNGLKGERSGLFYKAIEIHHDINPHWFLYENVESMDKKSRRIISDILGVNPVCVDSSLVSAQHRKRLYWTNIPGSMQTLFGNRISQPKDKHIFLRDIIEDDAFTDRLKSYSIDANYHRGMTGQEYLNRRRRQMVMVTNTHPSGKGMNGRVFDTSGKSPALTTNKGEGIKIQTSNNCVEVGKADLNGHDCVKRVYGLEGKCPTLCTGTGGSHEPKVAVNDKQWRKLSPVECERLQTLPDGYTEGVSNTQRYKTLGNGWTVDVIVHILQGLVRYCQ